MNRKYGTIHLDRAVSLCVDQTHGHIVDVGAGGAGEDQIADGAEGVIGIVLIEIE